MKKANNPSSNCIPTASTCVDWMGPDLPALGICHGQSLDTVVVEIVEKLGDITGEDISKFNIDSLLTVCKQKAPLEINLISVLTLIKDNQVCLKDYIDTLNDKIAAINTNDKVTANLKCYADFDNLGNVLSINRAELDQLVINELCNHEGRLKTVEGKVTTLKNDIANINVNPKVDEPTFSTCINPAVLSTSSQAKAIAGALCDVRNAVGLPAQISAALSKVPADWNNKFGLIQGWDLTPNNWAQQYGNLLLAFTNLLARVEYMEQNCCAIDCDDIQVGYFVDISDDGKVLTLSFNNSAGTKLPTGFIDRGSTGTIIDRKGNKRTFSLTITNDYELDIPITGLDAGGELTIDITTKIGNGSLMCTKCLTQTLELSAGCCILTNASNEDVTIVYSTNQTTNT